MAKARTLVGLDLHAAKVVAAILDSETAELRFQRLGGESEPVVKLCSSLEAPVSWIPRDSARVMLNPCTTTELLPEENTP